MLLRLTHLPWGSDKRNVWLITIMAFLFSHRCARMQHVWECSVAYPPMRRSENPQENDKKRDIICHVTDQTFVSGINNRWGRLMRMSAAIGLVLHDIHYTSSAGFCRHPVDTHACSAWAGGARTCVGVYGSVHAHVRECVRKLTGKWQKP